MRQYTGGETWTYNVTGTFSPTAGGVQTITPATANLGYGAAASTVGTVNNCHLMTLTVPIAFLGHNETSTYVVALAQAAEGTLTLAGLDPNASTIGALDTPLVGPLPTNFASTANWNGSSNVNLYGAFTVNTTNTGIENVTVGGKTFECHKVTGTKSLGGFNSTFTVWLNATLGSFAKMTTSYTDTTGTTNLTYELQTQSFNVG
jgi:hypothetical protein